jgi:hypothetical protein
VAAMIRLKSVPQHAQGIARAIAMAYSW